MRTGMKRLFAAFAAGMLLFSTAFAQEDQELTEEDLFAQWDLEADETENVVLDENGAIVKMTCDELILYAEYFTTYTLDEPSYKEGFVGLTTDSYTGEQAFISGATMSSDAVDIATKDAFAAFAAIS